MLRMQMTRHTKLEIECWLEVIVLLNLDASGTWSNFIIIILKVLHIYLLNAQASTFIKRLINFNITKEMLWGWLGFTALHWFQPSRTMYCTVGFWCHAENWFHLTSVWKTMLHDCTRQQVRFYSRFTSQITICVFACIQRLPFPSVRKEVASNVSRERQ